MKNLQMISLLVVAITISCKPSGKNEKENTEVVQENVIKENVVRDNDWVVLFDGKSLDNWTSWESATPPKIWSVAEDGSLYCKALDKDDAKPGDKGDIISRDQYENFHLKLEWKISQGGNSGIFYLGSKEIGSIIESAPEMQVLDNERHPDAKKGKNGNRKAGSLYDLIPAVPQNANPALEWNSAEIIVKDRHVIQKQNGETVVEYDLDTDEFKKLVSTSKFPKIRTDWYQVPQKGYIALQDHNNEVWYRNIMIKNLD